MKGRPSSSPQIHIHLPQQSDPARGSIHLGRVVCSEPSMQTVHRWETGQSTAPKADRTFGTHCTALAASNMAADSLIQQCKAIAGLQFTKSTLWSTTARPTFHTGCTSAGPTSPLGPIQWTWDPKAELVLLVFFSETHSGACTSATKASLYSVKKKAHVACLAPQHKSTWCVFGWRLHYPT